MTTSEARTEVINRYGSQSWIKLGPLGPTMLSDRTVQSIAFHEVFSGSERHISRWGIGRNWDEAFANCESRGLILPRD